jgi:hypothetical protein
MSTFPTNVTDGIAAAVDTGQQPPTAEQETPELLAKPKQTDNEMLQEAELMADPRVMMSSPLSASEIVASIKSGNPVGLEHMTLGSTSTGDPAAVYIDDFGQVQHHVLSTSQWMAMKESRSLNRSRVAQQEEKTRKLNEQREELSGAFKNGIDKVDNEAFRALLKQRFQDDPQGAMKMLIDDQRGDQRDAEANAKVQAAAIQAQAWSISSALQNENLRERQGLDARLNEAQQKAMTSKGDSSAAIAGINGQRREIAIRDRASSYVPTPQTIGMSPTQAMSPTQVQGMLAAWLAIPEVDRLVPHPSSPDYASAMEDVVASLNGVATDLGWQQTFTIEDMGRIEQAVMTHRNVHGETVELQRLAKENEELKKDIEALHSSRSPQAAQEQVSLSAAIEANESTARGMEARRGTEWDKADLNADGVVTAQEEAAFTGDVSTLDADRKTRQQQKDAASTAAAAKKSDASSEARADASQAMINAVDEMENATTTGVKDRAREAYNDAFYKYNEDEIREQIRTLTKQLANSGKYKDSKGRGIAQRYDAALKDSNHEVHQLAKKLQAEVNRIVLYEWSLKAEDSLNINEGD